MQLMKLDRDQGAPLIPVNDDGSIQPRSSGTTAHALNLRPAADDALAAVGASKVLATLNRCPLFCDERDGITHVFGISTANDLYHEGTVEADCTFHPDAYRLGTLDAACRHTAQAGEFLVLNLADGSLYYLLWHPDLEKYSAPGIMPAMPEPVVSVASELQFTAEAEAQLFRTTLRDLRPGVPAEAAAMARNAALAAWRRLQGTVRRAGRWMQPVVVRIGIRLWDGSLLHLSRPYVTGTPYRLPGRISLPLATDTQGYCGTEAATITGTGYDLNIHIPASDLARWADVVRRIEVWVSDEQETLAEQPEPSVAFNNATSTHLLAVNMPHEDTASLAASLASCRMRLLAVVPADGQACDIHLTGDLAGLEGQPAGERRSIAALKAQTIAGFGGFLHVSGLALSSRPPEMPSGAGTDPTTKMCSVEVAVATLAGMRYTRAAGTITTQGNLLLPYLWYPHRDARWIKVRILDENHARYEHTFHLTPSPCDEDAAQYVDPTFAPVALPQVSRFTDNEDAPQAADGLNSLVTTRRGNPLIPQSVTEELGGQVHAMEVQPVGGGAFTRQYVYAFTAAGITAVAIDKDGNHTTVRGISPSQVDNSRMVASTPVGVFAVSRNHELLWLRDAKVHIVLRRLAQVTDVVYDRPHHELRLHLERPTATPERSIVVPLDLLKADGRPVAAWLSSVAATTLAGTAALVIYAEPFGQQWRLVAVEHDYGPRAAAEWASAPLDQQDGGLCMLRAGVEGEDTDFQLRVSAERPGEDPRRNPMTAGVTLASAGFAGAATGEVEMPLMMPACGYVDSALPRRYRLSIAGRLERLTTLTL